MKGYRKPRPTDRRPADWKELRKEQRIKAAEAKKLPHLVLDLDRVGVDGRRTNWPRFRAGYDAIDWSAK